MAKSGVEDTALAVGNRHEERLPLSRSAGLDGRERCSEHGDVLRRSTKTIVELVLRVEPFRGETLRDRMIGILDLDDEFVLLSVRAAASGRGIEGPLAVALAQVGS